MPDANRRSAATCDKEWNPMADDSQHISQDEIEKLLAQAHGGSPAKPAAEPPPAMTLGQGDIDALLQSAGGKVAPLAAAPLAPKSAGADAGLRGGRTNGADPAGGLAAGDVEFLLHQAEAALASIDKPLPIAAELPVAPFKLQDFAGAPSSTEIATLDLIRDVDLEVKIELGRTQMYLEDVLRLRKGSVVPLDKLAGDPVDIYVNGRLIAKGEVLVMNDSFCVRVAELVAAEQAA
jgi:flagellar motor switch protein FliN/FliY